MALTDADRLQIVAMALMRHSVVGGGGAPAEALIKYFKKYTPADNLSMSHNHKFLSTDVTAGHTYFAYSELSSKYSADKAFDNNNSTYWRPVGITTDEYVGVDFGAGKTILWVTLYSSSSYRIRYFMVQGSNNASDWYGLYSGTALNSSAKQFFVLNNSTAYRYYRIKNNGAPYSTRIQINEIEMLEEV